MNWKGWLFGRRELTLALACVVVAVFFQFLSPYFLTPENLTTILRNSVELLLVSLGMTFILATAGIDIAVGGALGICAIFVGWSIEGGWPFATVVLIGPLIGTGLGLVSAILIVQGKIPPIIATLGLFGVYRAAIFLLLGGSWISGLPDTLGPAVNTSIDLYFVFLFGWLGCDPLGTARDSNSGNGWQRASCPTVRSLRG
jgi:AI-2 transport system permease protein